MGAGTVAGDGFGGSTGVSGSTIVVGAPAAPLMFSSVGHVFVFTKVARGWRQAAELDSPDPYAYDWFGDAVDVSGGTVVVGAPAVSVLSSGIGAVYVFTRTAHGWRELSALVGPHPAPADMFGVSVAVSGQEVVVGAPGEAGKTGAAYVFTRDRGGWQTTDLRASDTTAKDEFGDAVGISGGTVVVGAFAHGSLTGRAYVFTRGARGWHESAELAGSGTVSGDGFGVSVALAGGTIVVGAGLVAGGAGRAYVFAKGARGWEQTAELRGRDTVADDGFGDSVAIGGGTIVAGAFGHASSSGRAYVFVESGRRWHQSAELMGADTVAGDHFGYSVAVAGDLVVAGASYHGSAGRTYVFRGGGATPAVRA